MYKCGICSGISEAGEPRRTFTVYRDDSRAEIEREIPICKGCAEKMAAGETYKRLLDDHRPKEMKHSMTWTPPVKISAPVTLTPPRPRPVTFGGNNGS